VYYSDNVTMSISKE